MAHKHIGKRTQAPRKRLRLEWVYQDSNGKNHYANTLRQAMRHNPPFIRCGEEYREYGPNGKWWSYTSTPMLFRRGK